MGSPYFFSIYLGCSHLIPNPSPYGEGSFSGANFAAEQKQRKRPFLCLIFELLK
jgi:hypothetical protein